MDAELVAALLAANDALRVEMEDLDRRIAAAAAGSSAGRLEGMADTLNALRISNGAVAAVGPGVEVWISGSFTAATVRDVINELKSGGAEAIAVNGHRLTIWSAVYQSGEAVLLDGYDLGNVVVLAAIGDSATLAQVLERRGGLVAVARLEGTTIEVVERPGIRDVRLPMAAEQKTFSYAHAP